MAHIKSAVAENFSLTRGGPLHWLLVRMGHAGDGRKLVLRRALAVIIITWLPLLLLSIWQGLAWGRRIDIPFLKDMAVNVRLLIAVSRIPVYAPNRQLTADGALSSVNFFALKLVDEETLPSFEAILQRTVWLARQCSARSGDGSCRIGPIPLFQKH